MLHPDHLVNALTAEQLLEWWDVYQAEPWGETRADMRAAAGLALYAGSKDLTMIWPYMRERTFDDLVADAGLMEELQRVRNSRDNSDCD